MTTDTTTDAANAQQVDADDGTDVEATTTEDESQPDESRNAEAARWRVRLRETEVERDGLAGRVERLQTAQAFALTAGKLAQPVDLFGFGVSLADVLGDDGEVDAARVEEATEALLAARPGLAPPSKRARVDPAQGGSVQVPSGTSWSTLLKGKASA